MTPNSQLRRLVDQFREILEAVDRRGAISALVTADAFNGVWPKPDYGKGPDHGDDR